MCLSLKEDGVLVYFQGRLLWCLFSSTCAIACINICVHEDTKKYLHEDIKEGICVLKISSIGSHAIVWMHEIGQTPKSECGCPGGRGIENNHMYATHLLKNLWTTSVTEECRCL